jgi:tetratricopeptide (TPR) repeat protein/predicted Ser/Thr protein kinase
MLGRSLSHFRVLEEIGRGAMGVVYRARDVRLDRDVALKVIAPDVVTNPDRKRRFLQEARAAATLTDPNIAVVYEADEVDGVAFIAMELLQGSPLSSLMARQRLPPPACLDLGVQVADGLAAAHEHGIVHRDLKPANIIVDDHGRVKLIDFGLAKLREASSAVDSTVTALDATTPGLVVGTLAYMSPEQARGAAADPRSDVWSLGVLLFELLSGHRPFTGAGPVEVLATILRDPAPPLPACEPPLPPVVHGECARIVATCLAQDPEARYQNGREVARDLRSAIGRLRPVPAPDLDTRQTGSWFRRAATAVSAVVVTGVVGWLVTGRLAWEPVAALGFQERDWVVLADLQNDTGNPLFDRSLGTAFRVSLEQSSHANVFPPARVAEALRRMGRPDVERVDEELGREVCVRENARALVTSSIGRVGPHYVLAAQLVDPGTGNRVRTYSERAERDDELLDALDRIASALRRDLGETLAAIGQRSRPLPQVTTRSLQALKLYAEGADLWRRGEYNLAVRQYEAAVELDPDFGIAHSALGGAFMSFRFNERAKGRQHLERALALAHRTTDRERLVIEIEHARDLGTAEETERLYRLYLSQYPDDAVAHYGFGTVLMQRERPREAIEQLGEAVRIVPTFAGAYVNLATCRAQLGEHRLALADYDKAFALEPSWKLGANLNHEYGFAFVNIGEHEKARQVFGLATGGPDKAKGLRSLALLDSYEGRHRRAVERFREAALINEAAHVAVSAARDRYLLAATLAAMGDQRGASRELDAAARLLAAAAPQVWLLARVGQAYAALGAVRPAQDMLARARPHLEANNAAQQSDVLLLEAEIALARGRTAEAVACCDRAYRQWPRSMSLAALARAEAADGATGACLQHYRELMAHPYRSAGWEAQAPWLQAHLDFARLLEKAGQRDEARAVLDALLTRWKDSDGSPVILAPARALRTRLE